MFFITMFFVAHYVVLSANDREGLYKEYGATVRHKQVIHQEADYHRQIIAEHQERVQELQVEYVRLQKEEDKLYGQLFTKPENQRTKHLNLR